MCAWEALAVRVEEAAEAHDGLALGRVLREVQRLCDRHVEPAGQDLLLRLPVVRRRNELNVQARIGKVSLTQSDHERQVVGIEEPLEAKLDGDCGRGGGCHEEKESAASELHGTRTLALYDFEGGIVCF